MPRHPDAFELDAEDFLQAPPAFDSQLFGEIDPPAWALRAITKRGGKRHPRREIISVYVSPYHDRAITPFSPARPSWEQHGHSSFPIMGPHGVHRHGNADAKAIFDKAMAKERRKSQQRKSQEQVSARKLVPVGNLINDDYRYWKGYALSNAFQHEGTCRWCQEVYKGRKAMLEHHTKGSCKEHLSALYRYAKLSSKTQRYCFSCKKQTSHMNWGVPMCDTVTCLTCWKFKFNVQLAGFQQYREWALKAQLANPKKGPFGDLPAFDAGLLCEQEQDDEDFKGTPC